MVGKYILIQLTAQHRMRHLITLFFRRSQLLRVITLSFSMTIMRTFSHLYNIRVDAQLSFPVSASHYFSLLVFYWNSGENMSWYRVSTVYWCISAWFGPETLLYDIVIMFDQTKSKKLQWSHYKITSPLIPFKLDTMLFLSIYYAVIFSVHFPKK